MRITLLVNPRSGGGRSILTAPKVSNMLSAAGASVDVQFTSSMPDAVARARDIVAGGADALVTVGGDGMASVGLNACAGTDVALGIIPSGTGNDFCRGLGLPSSPAAACRVIAAGRTRQVDLLSAVGPGESWQRYVGSIVSTGYDALVNRATNRSAQFGALSYAVVALRELRRFKPIHYRLEIDGEYREVDAIVVAVGNAGYFGGGVKILPDFSVTDGLLDVTIVHAVHPSLLVWLFPQLWGGKNITHPALEKIRAKRVVVDGDGLFAMADGEELGDVPVTSTVAPGVLTVFS